MARKKIPKWRKDAESDLLFFLRNYNELKHNLHKIESLIDYYVELLKKKD